MTERQLDGKTEQSNDPAGPWGKTIHMHQYVGQQEPGEVDGPRGGPEEAKESERATHVRKRNAMLIRTNRLSLIYRTMGSQGCRRSVPVGGAEGSVYVMTSL